MRTRPLTLVWMASLLIPACVAAQDAGSPPAVAPSGRAESRTCFRPAPGPRCAAFWTTEFYLGRMITSPREVIDTFPGYSYSQDDGTIVVVPPEEYRYTPQASYMATWEAGLMRNVGADRALGGSIFMTVPLNDTERTQLGLRGRHRWWSLGGATVDLSPGVYLGRDRAGAVDGVSAARRLGFSLRGAVATRNDLVGLVAELDATPDRAGVQLGGRLAGIPGAIAAVAAPAGFLALWFLYPES
jgi:hypothetical protein